MQINGWIIVFTCATESVHDILWFECKITIIHTLGSDDCDGGDGGGGGNDGDDGPIDKSTEILPPATPFFG